MNKQLIAFFYNNKSLTHLLFVLLLVISFFSYRELPKEMFPPASLETIVVSGSYMSSSSELMDTLIVKDCEDILKNNPKLSNISTSILKGSYSISADIQEGSDKSIVLSEVKSAVEAIDTTYLPDNMKKPKVYTVERFFPLLSISIFSSEKSYQKYAHILKDLNRDIKALENVHKSELIGGFNTNLQIKLDYKKIEGYRVNKIEAIRAIDAQFSINPIGRLKSDVDQYYVSTKISGTSLEDVKNVQIKIGDKTLLIKDIATVSYRVVKNALTTRTNGKNSMIIMTKKAKKGDSIKLSAQIRKVVEKYEKKYPDLEFKVLNDSSFWIKTRLNVISSNIIIGLILLFFAIWIFISFKISLVVLIGIPVSIAFGLIGLDFFNSGLNTLSLIGVLLSLGLLVDEAIVVSENIHRHRLMGKDMKDACIDGTSEVLPTLFVALLTTVIAFLPLLYISGGLGIFVKAIPLMVVILLVSSFIESFVFLPSHYKILLHNTVHKVTFRDKIWDSMGEYYGKLLNKIIAYKYLFTAFFVIFTLGVSALFIKKADFILFPEFDAMSVNITGKVENNSLRFTGNEIKPLEKILLENLNKEDYSSVHTMVGIKTDGRGSHEKGYNLFTITINLKPKIPDDFFNRVINPYFQIFGENVGEVRSRTKSAKEIQEDLFVWLDKYKEPMSLDINIPQTGVTKSDVYISFSHNDDKKVQKAMEFIKEEMSKIEGVKNIKDDMDYSQIALEVEVNDYGKRLGFTQKSIIKQLRYYLRTQKVTKILSDNNKLMDLRIYVKDKTKVENFENLQLEIPNLDKTVNLFDVAKITYANTLASIKKDNQIKVFSISADLEKSIITSREFYKIMAPHMEQIKKQDITLYIKGEAGKNNQLKRDVTKSLIFSIFGILLILTWFFQSLRLSLFSLSVIPLAILGVMVGHFILNLPLTFSSILGFVGLTGIVMNDALLMLSFIRKASTQDEIIEYAKTRLRPVLLTSITTVLGLFTLMFLASGESLLMQPLAVSIGFGLLGATLINLLYVPVAYSIKFKKRKKNDSV